MRFNIFTLHSDLFQSFTTNSLIARAIAKNIIQINCIDWREKFGIGNYKQVDDKPFGGGSGMVLMAEPILNSLTDLGCVTDLKLTDGEHKSLLPNNSAFYSKVQSGLNPSKKVNVLMTPRGFPMTQQTVEWIADSFDEVNVLCGRYEGFDARVNDYIDLELSIGSFVLNGGEVGSMCLVEAVSRLVPDFITKGASVLHDSFSSGLNDYKEFEFSNSKTQYQKSLAKGKTITKPTTTNLFDDQDWRTQILPHIEHPQYTRPSTLNFNKSAIKIPEILLSGDHAKIQKWRMKWW
jgi:tRNA (guanine37-N1)-methyltransferase